MVHGAFKWKPVKKCAGHWGRNPTDTPAIRLIPSTKNSLGCCWNHYTIVSLNLWPFNASLRDQTHGSHMVTGLNSEGWCNNLQRVLDSASHMGMGIVVQYDDIAHEHARTLVLIVVQKSQRVPQWYYVLMVMPGSLSANFSSQYQNSEWQLTDPLWMDSAHGTVEYNCVTFPVCCNATVLSQLMVNCWCVMPQQCYHLLQAAFASSSVNRFIWTTLIYIALSIAGFLDFIDCLVFWTEHSA